MIVAVNTITEQLVVIKAWCLERGIDPKTIPTSMKCNYVIGTPGGLVQTNDMGEAWKYAKELDETCINFTQFVHSVLIPKYAEAITTAQQYKEDAKKYQEHINHIKAIFRLP